MNSLTAAHRGYEYQDLFVACRLVDVLLGSVVEARVDQKLVDGDVFDDLTTAGADGSRERVQFKHTDRNDRPLTTGSFTNDERQLRLDKVFAAMLADRDGPGVGAAQQTFRVVLRDTLPTDSHLTAVLRPAVSDPGPFLPTLRTVRFAFDADALWAQMEQSSVEGSDSGDGRFAFLRDPATPLAYSDLLWACGHLFVEVVAPAASRDLTSPGPAEDLLLSRVREDVGAGLFPNQDRDPVDVAAAIIGIARFARQGSHVVTGEEILRRAQLQTDFGAVARKHPVDPSVQVPRSTAAQQIVSTASKLAEAGGALLAVGPPGQGKSWLCQQVLEQLSNQGWLVAEHYCYLGDADSERSERVLAEAVFGSLVGRLADTDPGVVEGQRPLLAANEETLINCVARSIELEPQRPVALVIDGIDHITRVRAPSAGAFDPSTSLAEALASLEVPSGSVLIVLSQPGAHLRPLEHAGAATVKVEGLNDVEIRSLAAKLGLIPAGEVTACTTGRILIEDEGEIAEFLDALVDRSAGNALYATYLCREASRRDATLAGPAATVSGLPAFDGTLENYYQLLYSTLGEGGLVADVISLVPFAVTRSELRSMLPFAAHRVDKALEVLAPVLVERAAQGGVRVYHESFARYLRRPFQDNNDARAEIIGHVTAWLNSKGMFEDSRAFRSLLLLLAEAGRDAEAVAIVERDFVIRAVASGFPASAIIANLATAIRSAARLGNWPLVARYVELSRAVESYRTERLSWSLAEFADVPIALLGPSVVAERLVDDGRMVMAARDGLQVCAAVDACGAVAPWQLYMAGYIRESKSENTINGERPDRDGSLALLRGRLRLATTLGGNEAVPDDRVDLAGAEATGVHENGAQGDSQQPLDPSALINWRKVANWVQQHEPRARDVVEVIADTCGVDAVNSLIPYLEQPGAMCLALSEHFAHRPDDPDLGSAREWASEAVAHGMPPGALHAALSIDTGILDEIDSSIAGSRDDFLDLTRRVQEPSIQWESDDLDAWLDACTLAAHRDPLGLNAAEALIAGEGWYKCWLRFTTALVRAEAAHSRDKAARALEAIRCLQADLNPFSGDPRACDLYSIEPVIAETIRRAVALVDDEGWAEAIRLLYDVSVSITTTLHGSIGGPLPPDLVVRIAVDGSNSARRHVAAEVLEQQIEDGSAGRIFTDLAEFQLLGARLALKSDNHDEADRHWHLACQMLTSYGQRKDITIFELLDPLPELIAADQRRGQERVALVQPLCERVPYHTDRKATRWAWDTWWDLLALADPVALARLAAPRLLQRCNQPNSLLHDALEGLWRSWCDRADPLLAGALRLTLDTPLDAEDADALSLLTTYGESESAAADNLATWLLARADERPISYGDANSDELLARDDLQVAALNSVAEAADLPLISELRRHLSASAEQPSPTSSQTASTILGVPWLEDGPSTLPPGPAGLAHAIRSWRRRPYETADSRWTVDRFTNILGYRLLELADDGREQDAASALHSLAEACEFGPRTELLRAVAEGLDQDGRAQLASIAYTLVWTRTHGLGGSVNFAGGSEINSLHRATELDAALALRVVAEEVERFVVSRRSGTYGISQALMHAFCAGALAVPDEQALDVAFATWDEACAVISKRAPRVHASEDPEDPYVPADPADGAIAQSDLDAAFALGALASLAHPGREKKRRSLLAARLLLSERPAAAAAAFDAALGALSDPATIVWLLRLIELSGSENAPVVARCKQTLTRFATGQHLAVRALARRLLETDAPPLPLPPPADEELLSQSDARFWTPTGSNDPESDEPPGIDGLISSVAGHRLNRAKTLLPGLGEAVRTRVVSAMKTDRFKRQLRAQLDAFADGIGQRYPDAYLIGEQMTEEALQLAAAGGRTARIAAGDATSDPIAWENILADALVDDPTLPMSLEEKRIPRPPISFPPPLGSDIWAHEMAETSATAERDPPELTLDAHHELVSTIQVQASDATHVMEQAGFRGWRMIAAVEDYVTPHPDWNEHSEFVAARYRAVELRHPDDDGSLDMPPVTVGDIRVWQAEIDHTEVAQLPDRTIPLFGIDTVIAGARDGLAGLGVQRPLLAPMPGLVSVLQLRPAGPFTLDDSQGCGLALVIWRAAYETSEYFLPRPRLVGSAVLARPDLFDQFRAQAGDRLILRDFAALTRTLRQTRSKNS